jgi:acyl-CoA reductase-like NAD-dependent aldehyde dehydrogenase
MWPDRLLSGAKIHIGNRKSIMTVIKCISPVDGSVYAEREAMSLEAARAAVSKARKAQKDWARRPLEDRVQLVLKGVARLNEMVAEVVPELAHMMGRPVRYGGEFKGFNERSNYVASIAADALAPLVIEESGNFERRIEREAHGVVFVIAPWNYPYMTAINTVAPALMAGNTVVIKACGADVAGGRAHGAGFCRGWGA